jgi:hypothetical protein
MPDLSRSSIKEDSPINPPLFQQLSRLAARSLHEVKNLGLLTGEFLAVLPHIDETLPMPYRAIRESIIQEMRDFPLTPTQGKGYAPAKNLLQARAALKELLSDEDLAFLLARNDNPTWAIGAKEYSRQDYFLKSLGIAAWDVDDLIELLGERTCENQYPWKGRLDPEVMKWLASKTDEWHQQLYAVAYRALAEDDDFSVLDDAKIVRLSRGAYSTADKAYFPSGHTNASDPFPRVSESILTTGMRKTQQADARKFLENLGVREVGETEEIDLILKQRYAEKSILPTDDVYLADLKRFISFIEKNPTERQKFKGAFLFKAESDQSEWTTSAWIYLDQPYKETGLRFYHGALPIAQRKKWALSGWYRDCGIEQAKLTAFAEAVGCSASFSEFIVATNCSKNPEWNYLRQVPGERYTSPIDQDYTTSLVILNLLGSKNVEFSRLVWTTMCLLHTKYHQARYQRNTSSGCRKRDSSLIFLLKEAEWVPLKDGQFVAPRNASRDGLLSGFTFDAAYKWLELVNFGEDETKRSAEYTAQAKKRAEMGFESDEALERAQAFSKLPQNEQERILEEHRMRNTESPEEFPVQPIKNKELRKQRVQDQATQTPDKESQMRQRSVAVGYDAVKSDAKLYLREQYTNKNGVMLCQVCKSALPFQLPSGGYYFEAVEMAEGLSKRFRETFLALCPNHAAMFQYANDQRDNMQELLETAVGLEVEVTLGREPATILFTETHIADVQACLESQGMEEKDPA